MSGLSPTVEAVGVAKTYGRGRHAVHAVRAATLTVRSGEIVGIAGSSGSGKSTLLRLLAGIERPTHGRALLGGTSAHERGRSGYVMPIFQDPVGSLDPRWPICRSVTEPLTAPGRPVRLSASERRELTHAQLPSVGLHGLDIEARPGELSGGQCQRISILRALVAGPALLIADEPTSALDASVAAGILPLLRATAECGTSIVIVSHDLNVLAVLCDRVLEMRQGVLQPTMPA